MPQKSCSRTPWHEKEHKIHIVFCKFILMCDFRTYCIMIHMLAEVSIMTYIGLECVRKLWFTTKVRVRTLSRKPV